jgi:hypothetical protein
MSTFGGGAEPALCDVAIHWQIVPAAMQPTRRAWRIDMTKNAKREPNIEKVPYQPTTREQIVLDKHTARRDATAPAPRLKVQYDGNSKTISPDHPDYVTACELLMEALGTADVDFVDGLVDQLIAVSSHYGAVNESQLNFMLSAIKGIKPNDHQEAMLAAQMALVHMVTMRFGCRLAKTEDPLEQESTVREINRAARTYTGQMEALKRYRSGGEQKVQVSVSEGGQAIVGHVTQAPREATPEYPAKLTPVLTNARQPAMEIVGKAEGAPVPLRRRQNHDGPSST